MRPTFLLFFTFCLKTCHLTIFSCAHSWEHCPIVHVGPNIFLFYLIISSRICFPKISCMSWSIVFTETQIRRYTQFTKALSPYLTILISVCFTEHAHIFTYFHLIYSIRISNGLRLHLLVSLFCLIFVVDKLIRDCLLWAWTDCAIVFTLLSIDENVSYVVEEDQL